MEGIPVQNPLPVSGARPFFSTRNIILLVILVGIVVLSIVLFYLSQQRQSKTQSGVALQKEYSNPFDTKTQYTNPFSDYKNPFDNLTK